MEQTEKSNVAGNQSYHIIKDCSYSLKSYQIEMTGIGRVRVSVLVCHPFELGRVAVPCADVLRLQVLQLAVDVVPLAHDFKF